MILHAEGTAVDLRRAQLDQFEQLLVDAGLCSGLAERGNDLEGIGRQLPVTVLYRVGL